MMADQLDMGRLSLNDSQHAPTNGFERAAYIPPHLRNRQGPPAMDAPRPVMNGGGFAGPGGHGGSGDAR